MTSLDGSLTFQLQYAGVVSWRVANLMSVASAARLRRLAVRRRGGWKRVRATATPTIALVTPSRRSEAVIEVHESESMSMFDPILRVDLFHSPTVQSATPTSQFLPLTNRLVAGDLEAGSDGGRLPPRGKTKGRNRTKSRSSRPRQSSLVSNSHVCLF